MQWLKIQMRSSHDYIKAYKIYFEVFLFLLSQQHALLKLFAYTYIY